VANNNVLASSPVERNQSSIMNLNRNHLLTACFFAILAGMIVLRSMQVKSSHTANESTSGSVRTTKPFTSAGRASQGNPSSRNATASTTDDRLIQVPREVRKRILASYPHPIIKGKMPGNLTWSKDSLAILGLDEGQQERVQEALDQASARALEVIKRKVKPLPSDNDGDYAFEIPDWSKEEGVALRAEMTKALESEVSAADAAFLMNMIGKRDTDMTVTPSAFILDNNAAVVLFGEGRRTLSFHVENGRWVIHYSLSNESGTTNTGEGMSELPKEWLELFNLSNPGK
jgi:hypothetical protein